MEKEYFKFNLSHVWDICVSIAEERHQQKKNYKSCRPLSENYEVVGVCGEMLYSLLKQKSMDTLLRAGGDDGYDFPGINIKSSEEHKAKHLIEFIDKNFDGWYVFIIINLEKKYGYVRGYIHSTKFQEIAEIRNFGYGDRKCITLDELTEYTPNNPLLLNNIYGD